MKLNNTLLIAFCAAAVFFSACSSEQAPATSTDTETASASAAAPASSEKQAEEPTTETMADNHAAPSSEEPQAAEEQPVADSEAYPESPIKVADHSKWDGLMHDFVKDGKVNYKGIKADARFAAYLAELKSNVPNNDWTRDQKMAYWINAYNAFTVKLMIDNYPLKSIMDLDGGKVWDRSWIQLGGKTYSLNNIEHDILRKELFDPRIHFGVVCASFSCPPLRSEAFTADKLNAQLDDQAKTFINDSRRNTLDPKKPKISSLFDWYKDDFTRHGTVIEYINKYATTKIGAEATLGYMDYDWSVNE